MTKNEFIRIAANFGLYAGQKAVYTAPKSGKKIEVTLQGVGTYEISGHFFILAPNRSMFLLYYTELNLLNKK